MDSELFNIIIPSIAFFVAFFMAFILLEMVVTIFINRFVFNNWGLVTYATSNVQPNQAKLIRNFFSIFIGIFILVLIKFTSVIDILFYASLELKVFAAEVFLGIIFIYLITTHGLPKVNFLKQVHKYLYIYISAIVYLLVIVTANQYYDTYQQYINAKIVAPIVGSGVIENMERKKLLKEFRQQIYQNACPRIDYTEKNNGDSAMHFVYVTTQTDLKINKKPINRGDLKAYLTGRLCSNGEESFLLTDYGQWYWVIEG